MIKGFITNLGKYNEGELVGEWIEFPIDEEELSEVLERIGISAKENEDGICYEEYFFTDWDIDYDCKFGEYISIEEMNEIAERCEVVERRRDENALNSILEYQGCTLDEALDIYEGGRFEYYDGYSLRSFAEELADDYLCCAIEDERVRNFVQNHFNYDSYADELDDEGYNATETGIIIFC